MKGLLRPATRRRASSPRHGRPPRQSSPTLDAVSSASLARPQPVLRAASLAGWVTAAAQKRLPGGRRPSGGEGVAVAFPGCAGPVGAPF